MQTIYNSIGPKHEILSRVLDFAAAGERAPVPVAQFMREQAEGDPDPRRIIAQLLDGDWQDERWAAWARAALEAALLEP